MARPVFIYNVEPPELAASIPLQALIPARQIGAKALFFGPGMDAEVFLGRHSPDVLIITKMFDDAPLALAEAAVRRGVKVIGVFCDLRRGRNFPQRNLRLTQIASRIAVPTGAVAEVMRQEYGCAPIVVEEPTDYPRGQPRFAPGTPLKVLWHGHSSNHDTLPDGIRKLAAVNRQVSLMIVSGNAPPDLRSLQAISPRVTVSFVQWSQVVQLEMLKLCDLVFIPSNDSPAKQAKGQFRLISAIQAGRVAVAHPLPQYAELSAYCYCSADYAAAVDAAIANPAEAIQRVAAGQRHIDGRFSQEACASKWLALFDEVLATGGAQA